MSQHVFAWVAGFGWTLMPYAPFRFERVAGRKLVSLSPSDLLPEDRFRLYAVCARYPRNLTGQIPWLEQQAGVYDCRWGLDTIRVIVAGQLPREAHNAPLHPFSASPELIGFGQGAYRRRKQ